MLSETTRAIEALHAIPPDIDRDSWVRAGMAAQAAGLNFDDFNDWSAGASNYDERAARETWRSFKPGKGVSAGTLYRMAAEIGGYRLRAKNPQSVAKPSKRVSDTGNKAQELWGRFEPASNAHPYLVAKNAASVPLDGLRMVPMGDALTIQGERMEGSLVVPVRLAGGEISTLQFITPAETAQRLKSKGKPNKLNLPGHSVEGWFTVGEVKLGEPAYLCEGLGTAWACWLATGRAAVVCFGWGKVKAVAAELSKSHDRLVIVPDVGKESDAFGIAAEVGAAVAVMPEGWEPNSDMSDLAQAEGVDVVERVLNAATEPPPPPLPLSVAFADELPEDFTPPDELVEGVLTAGDGAVLYGDSNSGKTFFVIDLACAVARGVPWMGRKTEQGLVVYLAAESPASVRSRLQAYQKHHGVKVPNFAIVQSPIDLFDGDSDTNALITVIKQLERQSGQKAWLIVGDTLARLSAGANENAGQDMGLVVRRFDHIRTACNAHFLLIHHSGKAAANGARGWSGIRAAVDTEIEVTDTSAGKCAEITKQRDLSTKGQRIGYRLEPVTLGVTKWGAPATSCVVMPTEAPEKSQKPKRMGEVEAAALEYLSARKVGVKKGEVVEHFKGRYEKGPIYRALKSLVEAGAAHEAAGMVCIAGAAK